MSLAHHSRNSVGKKPYHFLPRHFTCAKSNHQFRVNFTSTCCFLW